FIVDSERLPQLVAISVAPADQSGSLSLTHGTGWIFPLTAPVAGSIRTMLNAWLTEGSDVVPLFTLPVVVTSALPRPPETNVHTPPPRTSVDSYLKPASSVPLSS